MNGVNELIEGIELLNKFNTMITQVAEIDKIITAVKEKDLKLGNQLEQRLKEMMETIAFIVERTSEY